MGKASGGGRPQTAKNIRLGRLTASGSGDSAQIGQGIDRGAVDLDLKVAVVAGGAPGGAHPGDGLAAFCS